MLYEAVSLWGGLKMNRKFIKGFILGFVVGIVFMSSSNDRVNASYSGDMSTERGAVEWKPIYVKIVK